MFFMPRFDRVSVKNLERLSIILAEFNIYLYDDHPENVDSQINKLLNQITPIAEIQRRFNLLQLGLL